MTSTRDYSTGVPVHSPPLTTQPHQYAIAQPAAHLLLPPPPHTSTREVLTLPLSNHQSPTRALQPQVICRARHCLEAAAGAVTSRVPGARSSRSSGRRPRCPEQHRPRSARARAQGLAGTTSMSQRAGISIGWKRWDRGGRAPRSRGQQQMKCQHQRTDVPGEPCRRRSKRSSSTMFCWAVGLTPKREKPLWSLLNNDHDTETVMTVTSGIHSRTSPLSPPLRDATLILTTHSTRQCFPQQRKG